jgi:hypothetical protein
VINCKRFWRKQLWKVLSQHLPGRTEQNDEKPQWGWLISRPRFEPRISWIQSQIVNHLTTTFGDTPILKYQHTCFRTVYRCILPVTTFKCQNYNERNTACCCKILVKKLAAYPWILVYTITTNVHVLYYTLCYVLVFFFTLNTLWGKWQSDLSFL